jgi:1-pyrroline-5-carboxylate dehydrogenase
MRPEFQNEQLTDFGVPENQRKMREAIAAVETEFGTAYQLLLGGKKVAAHETFPSINPSVPDEVVGVFAKADAALADQALDEAGRAFESWKWVSADDRAELLFKAAEIMRRRRFELSAWMVLEEGKNWVEADADTAEAIDFLEFYGREMLRYAEPQPLTRMPNEDNELQYIPLGVGVVIPPWNFPLAILCGMTSAAVVAGNTVVLKPSSDSPAIAMKFMEVFQEAGMPDGVINLLTGPGRIAGEHLVQDKRTRFVCFTGSMDVGLRINEVAAKTQPGQIWIKRVIAEMGGKDSIVVSDDCDLEAAVAGVVASAFGFQGQKCSACSRAVVMEKVYDRFLEMLAPATEALVVGPAKEMGTKVGPVINEGAMLTILRYMEIGKKEGRLLTGGRRAPGDGYFLQPTVVADVPPDAVVSQEEIFGPVLTVIKARDYDDALAIANNTMYGLTGSVYAADRERIERAKQVFHVGNLYVNRKCTGALVGVHPFGGFNMSGTDSKAGGRDYLLLFTQAKAISEYLPARRTGVS